MRRDSGGFARSVEAETMQPWYPSPTRVVEAIAARKPKPPTAAPAKPAEPAAVTH